MVGRLLAIMTVVLLVHVSAPTAASEQGQGVIPPMLRFVAHSLELAQSESAGFSWSASASVEFTIGDDSATMVFVNMTGVEANGTFVAPSGGWYSFRFRNPNDFPVSVQWTIRRVPSSIPMLAIASLAIVLIAVSAFAMRALRRRGTLAVARFAKCQRCGSANRGSRKKCFQCGLKL